ncbi:uncharacterized protein LAESUDRAFT_529290 [Laetiporus sulphureus 93-53]|uniref:F-box domain-containing protein n=1 Tax=Laetiporus sulphureus 93-53 TaxID=1314785 RepID=A0A165BBZ6_9APHY|nr:uncharacterized protein LAESUDRAFT_529290 [Laetiporus sulphureus 93-53]KZT00705.1 hypothetical protein LAESUDRAFT_529290 [Laetiporus sulphureus 93-53]
MDSIEWKLKRLADGTKRWRLFNSQQLAGTTKERDTAGRTASSEAESELESEVESDWESEAQLVVEPEVQPVSTRTVPQLPMEVCENVIDHLWDDQRALRQCTRVCRAWYPPSRVHLHRQITISSVEDVQAYAKKLKQTPELSKRPHNMAMMGGGDWRSDLSVLSTAAILLAPKLPRMETLEISMSEWKPWTMHRDIFLHLSCFSVTRLNLYRVTFSSINVFGRFVCALRALVELELRDVEFIRDEFHRDTFGLYRNRVNIRFLLLGAVSRMRPENLMDFLTHPCISSRLQRLIIDDSPSGTEKQDQSKCQQLLDAASGSLLELPLVLPYSGQQTHTEVSAAGV